MFHALYNQIGSRWTYQASLMDGSLVGLDGWIFSTRIDLFRAVWERSNRIKCKHWTVSSSCSSFRSSKKWSIQRSLDANFSSGENARLVIFPLQRDSLMLFQTSPTHVRWNVSDGLGVPRRRYGSSHHSSERRRTFLVDVLILRFRLVEISNNSSSTERGDLQRLFVSDDFWERNAQCQSGECRTTHPNLSWTVAPRR